MNDLVLLDNVDEQKIVECLENHHSYKEIYTYIGPVLISVNPYTDISGLYGPSKIKKFVLKKEYENYPHVYAVAERAYRNMVSDLSNECVVITGESGSGKTEASKKVMEYVAAMSSKSREVQRVKNQLLESNPLLESFGNAKTVRNDNSSRFGKYMEILFLVGDPAGGKITTYLLEKSRVVGQQKGERNFHVFYELLQDKRLKGQLGLGSTRDYRFLSDPESAECYTIDDRANLEDTKRAMEYIGLNSDEQTQLFSLVAFVLTLGNCDFKGGAKSKVSDSNALHAAAQLLQVSTKDLEFALTHRTVKSGIEQVKTGLKVEDAHFARDSLAKSVYDKLFEYIVRRANEAIACSKFSTSLGVLDIYGFEILGVNGFEQLCINYTNEKLHQLFIELTLKAEQEEYKKEGIAWERVSFYDNKPICELVERKGALFSLLDEESIFPAATDATLFNKLKSQLRQPEFEKPSTGPATQFRIKHYAGKVTYEVTGMLERNKDTLFPDLVQVVAKSSNPIAKQLFENHQANRKSTKVFKRSKTTCMQYKESVQELMDDLAKCSQHYIRCIKPNEDKAPALFDRDLVLTQCRYLGLLENVKVRRAGYAFRMTFDNFAAKYKCTLPDSKIGQYDPDSRRMTNLILGSRRHELGRTKVFIKDAASILDIEDKRKEFLANAKLLLPPEEEGLIFADKVMGINEKFVKTNLTFCVGGTGFYWYNGDGSVAQFFPMEKLDYIGYNPNDGWMTVHARYPSKIENETVNLTYLSENIYSDTVLNFVEAMHSMGFDNVRASKVSSYPIDAVDRDQYKLLVKNIAKGEKPTVARGQGPASAGCTCCNMQ